jgi:hypothetical protein
VEVKWAMKMPDLVVMASMVSASLFAGQTNGGEGGNGTAAKEAMVIVCVESDASIPVGTLPLASEIFARIGVRIDWRLRHTCPVGAGTVRVSLSYDTAHHQADDALAFALPHEGIHIVVFPDRVRKRQRLIFDQGPHVMAHVLVHEITHILEGVSRHSTTGIMKARWSVDDYETMRRKPLPFAQEDIDLIYHGLQERQAYLATTATSSRAVAGP